MDRPRRTTDCERYADGIPERKRSVSSGKCGSGSKFRGDLARDRSDDALQGFHRRLQERRFQGETARRIERGCHRVPVKARQVVASQARIDAAPIDGGTFPARYENRDVYHGCKFPIQLVRARDFVDDGQIAQVQERLRVGEFRNDLGDVFLGLLEERPRPLIQFRELGVFSGEVVGGPAGTHTGSGQKDGENETGIDERLPGHVVFFHGFLL